MFLTNQILEELNACAEGKAWFARHYPDGAELMEVIRGRHIPPSFLYWGKLYLTTTPEEQRAYDEVLEIKDSENIFQSMKVSNSSFVTNSNTVSDSKYIYNSRTIQSCTDITDSARVTNSCHIASSNSIQNSSYIVRGHNIKDTQRALNGSYLINSNNIYNSDLITNSSFILNSRNLTDCGFVADSSDSQHCLFCSEYNEHDYSIFNHPISQTQWNFIKEELDDWASLSDRIYLALFDHWEQEDPVHGINCHYSYLEMFKAIAQDTEFMNWIYNLPYFDANIAYKITFIPNFMQ